jgi:hypothetical protein
MKCGCRCHVCNFVHRCCVVVAYPKSICFTGWSLKFEIEAHFMHELKLL